MTELDLILDDLRRRHSDALETIEHLQASRQQVNKRAPHLENPKAVVEYIDFFSRMFTEGAAELARLMAELPAGVKREHLETLRQLASNGAVEQRRCLMFRDKWINRPLPHEDVRGLLNQISVDSRDRLTGFRSLTDAAERLQQLADPDLKPPDSGKLDRRALFTRWFGD